MRVLIGYDGSDSAEAAIADLKRAGMPREAEAKVVAVADLLMSSPKPDEIIKAELMSRRIAASLKHAQTHADRVIKEAEGFALEAAEQVREQFPDWEVTHEVTTGTPAWQLIDAAAEWEADLIVVGSKGRSALKRLLIGSVSKRVATDARSSVRVVRPSNKESGDNIRLVVGVDGSPAAEQAIWTIGQRVWPGGTEVDLIAVNDNMPAPARVSTLLPQAAEMLNSYNQNRESRVHAMLDWATRELHNIGLKTSVDTIKGEPGKVIVDEARKRNADSIFVGTRDFANAFERFRLGSVSTTVVTHAHCSVEIVRPPRRSE